MVEDAETDAPEERGSVELDRVSQQTQLQVQAQAPT